VTSVRVAFNQDIKSIEPDPAEADVWFLYWTLKAYEPVILRDGVKKGAKFLAFGPDFWNLSKSRSRS